ncbi:predicted protein [Chaetoceros tenuissimus]|uniref:Uncharacterized protein n=1 Tax=Chaetoceros tenuissimus TaxID=426638 RepID=A0AAD3CG58_9STRA|nr:predicted protein [Chaetoceros tenuissimus]
MIPAQSHHKHTSIDNQSDSKRVSSHDLLSAITDRNNERMKALLLLNTSLHYILPLPEDNSGGEDSSIEQQLYTLEKESNDFFESLKKKAEQEKCSDQHDGSSTVSHNASGQDTTMHYEVYCDITLGTKESTISSRSERKKVNSFNVLENVKFTQSDHDLLSETEECSTTQEEGFFVKLDPTNLPSEVFDLEYHSRTYYEYNKKPSSIEEVHHNFVKEYESRAKDLCVCMNRSKSSRSKVAKVKQYLKKRYSSRSNKLGAFETVRGVTKTSDGQLSPKFL